MFGLAATRCKHLYRIDIDIQQPGNVVFGFHALGMTAPGGDKPDFKILPDLPHAYFIRQFRNGYSCDGVDMFSQDTGNAPGI